MGGLDSRRERNRPQESATVSVKATVLILAGLIISQAGSVDNGVRDKFNLDPAGETTCG